MPPIPTHKKSRQNLIIFFFTGTATKEKILEEVRAAKYFGIILDCTPDISHQEQMTLVLRYVDMTGIPNIVERFVEFLKVDDSSGEGLTDELINALEKNNLEIMDARAQDYDNGSNMKGKEKGVQSRVKKINKRAMHVSCCAHSLNLVLCEMASCHKEAMTFFGVIQRLYTLVSASTKRWDIFKVYCTNLTLKPLSDTRWESHVESVKTVRFQLGNVCSALEKIAETTSDPAVRSEALSLVEHSLKSLEFVLGLVLWYDLLQAVNRVSKTLQAVDSTLDTTLQHLQGLKSFIQDYRENGFKKALTTARELVESLGCESEFKVPRIRRPKPQLGQKRTREPNRSEEVSHQELQDEAEEKFRIGYFLPILDVALTSMSSRFEEIEFYASKFGFLFNPSKLSDQEDEKLEEFCKNLAIYLKDGDSEDIDETDFVAEMKSFKYVVPSSVTTALGALRYLGPIRESYPNLTIALRIMLTIPMTVASGERSFSKLKIIKNYLRSTMSQARLNDLAMISIEREVAHSLRMDELISNFAYAKARRAPFL